MRDVRLDLKVLYILCDICIIYDYVENSFMVQTMDHLSNDYVSVGYVSFAIGNVTTSKGGVLQYSVVI